MNDTREITVKLPTDLVEWLLERARACRWPPAYIVDIALSAHRAKVEEANDNHQDEVISE